MLWGSSIYLNVLYMNVDVICLQRYKVPWEDDTVNGVSIGKLGLALTKAELIENLMEEHL